MTGQLFGGRYQVGDTLGFGGMSEVHRGRDLRLGRDVAIKVLRADLARDPSFQTRFRREAQNAASLNHPAIVAVYDTGETTGPTDATDPNSPPSSVPYIVMEYVDGETLRDLLKREGPLDPRRAMEITADVCAALDFSHRHGIVHRDVKPANIMLTRAGAVKVMDFGIARAVADGQSTMTATAAVIGTAQYLSPEQARGEPVDARSDVYSTGCVLYELLTGQPPFTGDSPVAVAYQHVREDPKPPSALRPGLPRELDAITLKALNKNPLNRYQTAAEMRADLVRALSGQAVQAPRVMDDAERTELLGAAPTALAAGGGAGAGNGGSGSGNDGTPPILAPPQRIAPQRWDDDDRESSRAKKVWGYLGIGALCLALLAGAIFLTVKITSQQPKPQNVAVPALAGMTEEQARAELTSMKLKLANPVEQRESSDADKGKVIDQNPSPHQPVQPDSEVTIVVGSGVPMVAVPNLTGFSQAEAKSALTGENLQMKLQTEASDTVAKDKVIRQDPATGTRVKSGATVTVVVSGGPNLVAIPGDLVGKPFSEVQQQLQKLKLNAVAQSVPSTEKKDTVIKLVDRQAGQKVPEGTVLQLQTSDESQFKMPNVSNQGLSSDAAIQQLTASGWKGSPDTVDVKEQETNDDASWGNVIGQGPAAGTAFGVFARPSLTVAVPPKMTIPSWGGKTKDAYAAELAGLGLRTQINWTANGNRDPNLDFVVRDCIPEANSVIRVNESVSCGYYDAAPKPTPQPQPPAPQPPATPTNTATQPNQPVTPTPQTPQTPQTPPAATTATTPPPAGNTQGQPGPGNGNGNGNGRGGGIGGGNGGRGG